MKTAILVSNQSHELPITIISFNNWHKDKQLIWKNQELYKADTSEGLLILLDENELVRFNHNHQGSMFRNNLCNALVDAKTRLGDYFFIVINGSEFCCDYNTNI